MSNSYWLDVGLGWRGICLEPNPVFFRKLFDSERTCAQLNFGVGGNKLEYVNFISAPFIGGVEKWITWGHMDRIKKETQGSPPQQQVVTVIPLIKILKDLNFPQIDYLSIDCEGCELEALANIDPSRFKIIHLEQNASDQERSRQVDEILRKYRFRKARTNCGWDYFFVNERFSKYLSPNEIIF